MTSVLASGEVGIWRLSGRGFPALDLAYLRRLLALPGLTDEEMVNQFKTHMLDSTAPSP